VSLAHTINTLPNSPTYPIAQLARTLRVCRGSFYHVSLLDQKDKALAVEIERYHNEVDDTLGHRKLAVLLKTGKNRVKRVMGKYGITARVRSTKYHYAGKALETVPNRLRQLNQGKEELSFGSIIFSDMFEFKLSDETRIRGCFALLKETRQILSLVFDYRMRAELVTTTLERIDTQVLTDITTDTTIFHTDQGSQYGAGITIRSVLEAGFQRSMSRAGTPTDNPFAERFVGIFKLAVVKKRSYATLHEFTRTAQAWVTFYNDERPHAGIHMQSPNTYAASIGYLRVPTITKLCV
jgi:putative transposase